MIVTACNYNALATTNDGSCVFPKCPQQRCPGDADPEPFMDNCGVCDADPANDNACEAEPINPSEPIEPDDPIETPSVDCL